MNIDFKDKVILVTGSTSGIGRQIVKQLLESQANVIIVYGHNEKRAKEVREELSDYKDNVLLIKADLSNENDVNMIFDEITKKYDKLDGLLNCPVYVKKLSIEDMTVEEYRHELDVNVVAQWQCIKNAIPLMQKADSPRIINIVSELGTRPIEKSIACCTCTAATTMLTQCCALELAKYNIRVNTVSSAVNLTSLGMQSYPEDKYEEFETNRLILRKITDEDALMLYENVFNNFEWFKFYYQLPFKDFDEYKHLVEKYKGWYANGNHFRWGIVEKKSGNMIGTIQLHTKDLLNNNCKIGYVIGYKYARKGYTKEASKTIIDFAFNCLNFHRIEADIVAENIGSINLARSIGMQFESVRKGGYKLDEKYYDQKVYVLLNNNYRS